MSHRPVPGYVQVLLLIIGPSILSAGPAAASPAANPCAQSSDPELCSHLMDVGSLAVYLAAQGSKMTAQAAARHCGWFRDNFRWFTQSTKASTGVTTVGRAGGFHIANPSSIEPSLSTMDQFCCAVLDPGCEMDSTSRQGVVVTEGGRVLLEEALNSYREALGARAAPAIAQHRPPVQAAPAATVRVSFWLTRGGRWIFE